MRLDVVLPDESTEADPRSIAALASRAEDLGYGGVWLPDHLLPPTSYGSTYGGVFEPLMLLSHISAVTTSILLGTSVLILPLRDPFLLAKQTATLDRLAPGRAVLGVGVGWDRTEFHALGVGFTDRGTRTDEVIDLVRHLHRTGRADFQGRFHQVEAGVFEPRPSSAIPIMVGGVSDAALRRAARRGDIWQAVGLTPEEFRERCRELRSLAGSRRIEAGARISWNDSGPCIDSLVQQAQVWAASGAEHLAIHFGELLNAEEHMTAFIRRYCSDHLSS